ncbi:hypothetical protein ACF0H5_015001 [Mactra antiquata]
MIACCNKFPTLHSDIIKILILLISSFSFTWTTEDICILDNICIFNTTEYEHVYSESCKPCVCRETCAQDDICQLGEYLEPGQEECVHQIHFYNVSNPDYIFYYIHSDLRPSYYVVSKCPNGVDDRVKSECESNENRKTIRYVSGVTTYRIYKNEICAKCNGEHDFVRWSSAVNLHSGSVFDLFNSDPTDIDIVHYVNNEQVHVISVPPLGYPENLNTCSDDVIDSCNVTGSWDYFDINLVRLCSSSQFKLSNLIANADEGHLYRNVYCTLCNIPRLVISTSHCEIGDISFIQRQPSYIRLIVWPEDIDSDREMFDSRLHCSNNQMVDPLEGSCLNISCPIGQQVVAGECQKGKLSIEGIAVYFYVTITLPIISTNVSKLTMMNHVYNWCIGQFNFHMCHFCSPHYSAKVENNTHSVYEFFISHTLHANCNPDTVIEIIRNFENLASDNITYTTADGFNFTASVELLFEPGPNTPVVPPKYCLNDKRLWKKYYCPAVLITAEIIEKILSFDFEEQITLFSESLLYDVMPESRDSRGTSPTKRVACMKTSVPDFREVCSPFQPRDAARDLGLEKALTSSPLQSPIPRATPSTLGCVSRNTFRRTPSVSSLECSDEEINEEIWRQPSPDSPDNLFVVGSKPRLHGMWQVPDLGSVTPSKVQQAVYPTREDCYDYFESPRETAVSPDNPPPSPINFRADMTGVVVGGQKMSYPERPPNTPDSSRDFNPGFVKKPLHHCLKCEGRVLEEELTQVTLHKRLSSILNNHMIQKLRHDEALMKSNSLRDFRDRTESCDGHVNNLSRGPERTHAQTSKSANLSRTRSKEFYESNENGLSFCEMYALKKKEKIDRERETKEMREQRLESKRVEEIKRLKEKIASKDERSQRVLLNFKEKMSGTSLHSKVHQTNMETGGEMTKSDKKMILNTIEHNVKYPPADITDTTISTNSLEQPTEDFVDNKFTGDEEERLNKLANYVIKKSWSDVFPRQKSQNGSTVKDLKPFKVDRHDIQNIDNMANTMMVGRPAPTVFTSKTNAGNMDDKSRDGQVTTDSKRCVPDRESPVNVEPLTPIPSASNGRINNDQPQEM